MWKVSKGDRDFDLIMHYNAIKHLFLDVHEWITRFKNNHQLYDSVTSLMIKLCTQLNDVLRFANNLNTVNFGETINRLVILSLARVIKTRYKINTHVCIFI